MLEEISFINPEDKSVTNTIKLEGINILVGPNNSGKTFLLKNLYDYFKEGSNLVSKVTQSKENSIIESLLGNRYATHEPIKRIEYFKAKVDKSNEDVQKLIHKKVLAQLNTLTIIKSTEKEFIRLVGYDSSSFDNTEKELLNTGVIQKKLTYQELIRIYSILLNNPEQEKAERLINRFGNKFNVAIEKRQNKKTEPDLEGLDSIITETLDGIKESPDGNNCIKEMVQSRKKELNNRIKKYIIKKIIRKIGEHPIASMNTLIEQNILNIEPYYKELESRIVKGNVIEFATFLKPANVGDTKSLIWNLYVNDELMTQFRETVKDILDISLALDITDMKQVVLRVVNNTEDCILYEKSINTKAKEFFANKKSFYDNASDGILSLVGLLLFLLCNKDEKKIILLDEPDAFLHPPLAKKLGKFLSDFSEENKIQFFISTHSSSIIEGCLQNKKSLNVIRLTYFNEQPKYYNLDKDILFEMVKDPSLRSNNIISSIFYNSVILCEGDSDRKLYSEVNEKLSEGNNKNVFYLYSDGNGHFDKFINPIKRMGLPIAIITDLDIICESNRLKNIFESIGIGEFWDNYNGRKDFALNKFNELLNKEEIHKPKTPEEIDSIIAEMITLLKEKEFFLSEGQTKSITKHVKKTLNKHSDVISVIHENGIYSLEENKQTEVNKFLSDLADKGIFLVPVGTLESWFSKYNISIDHTNEKSKKEWLIAIFDLFSKNSIQVEPDDIWRFMNSVNKFLTDKVNKV